MSIPEHIQTVTEHIADQRSELTSISADLTRATAICALSIVGCAIANTLLDPTITIRILNAAVVIMSAHNLVRLYNDRRLKQELLSQNEFYHELIVEETYTGKTVGPSLDQD